DGHGEGTGSGAEWGTLQLSGRELDAAADRGTVGERARQFQELIAEFACRVGAVDDGPINHELLCAKARPFDEAKGDALLRAGFDRIHHVWIGDRSCVAFALQQEFGWSTLRDTSDDSTSSRSTCSAANANAVWIRISAASASMHRTGTRMHFSSRIMTVLPWRRRSGVVQWRRGRSLQDSRFRPACAWGKAPRRSSWDHSPLMPGNLACREAK